MQRSRSRKGLQGERREGLRRVDRRRSANFEEFGALRDTIRYHSSLEERTDGRDSNIMLENAERACQSSDSEEIIRTFVRVRTVSSGDCRLRMTWRTIR